MFGMQPQAHREGCGSTGGASVPQKRNGAVSSVSPIGGTAVTFAVVNGAVADGMPVESLSALAIISFMSCCK